MPVRSISVLASALSRNHVHRRIGSVHGGQRAALEVFGIGEEQRRVVAIDQQPGNLAAGGVVVDVVHTGQPRERIPRCHRVVGRCGAAGPGSTRPRPPLFRTAHRRSVLRRWWPAPRTVRCAGTGRSGGTRRSRSTGVPRTSRGHRGPPAERWRGLDPGTAGSAAELRRSRGSTAGCGYPSVSPIAVRLPLLLTGNPENNPAPRLAAPKARNSCRASTTSRRLAANARAVTMLSE